MIEIDTLVRDAEANLDSAYDQRERVDALVRDAEDALRQARYVQDLERRRSAIAAGEREIARRLRLVDGHGRG